MCDLSSAHVSHFFFGKGSVGKERMDTFCSFSTLRQLTVASSAPVFGPRVALSAPFRRIFGKFRHLDATSGSYREALWPPGCSFGAISAPGCHFGQLQGSALATWMRFWRPVGTWMPLRKDPLSATGLSLAFAPVLKSFHRTKLAVRRNETTLGPSRLSDPRKHLPAREVSAWDTTHSARLARKVANAR